MRQGMSGGRTPGHDGESADGRIAPVGLPLTRRELLGGSAVLLGTLAAGSMLAALAPSRAWALELGRFSEAEAATLLAMGRTLYPHEKLPDAVYALLVKDLDRAATADSAVLRELQGGVVALDAAAGGSFAAASPERRLQAVTALQSQPFFARVRGQCITSLYDNDMAYAAFGYPGSSYDKGGYITRGFQDLKWLPAPPVEASPKPWLE